MNLKKQKRKLFYVLLIAIILVTSLPLTAFAISDGDVEAQISASSRESVAGNVFIWFLCAIAFLRVSQKIDSFMSSLGINVGHTGGNMLAEAMIAAKSIGAGNKFFSGGAFGGFGRGSRGPSSSGGSTGSSGAKGTDGSSGGFMSGGLVGAVGRKIERSAVQSATGQGGVIQNAAFTSSLNKGGELATKAVGTVAKGSISSTGSMTGEQAAKGLASYLGYGASPISDTETTPSSSSSDFTNYFSGGTDFDSASAPYSPSETPPQSFQTAYYLHGLRRFFLFFFEAIIYHINSLTNNVRPCNFQLFCTSNKFLFCFIIDQHKNSVF